MAFFGGQSANADTVVDRAWFGHHDCDPERSSAEAGDGKIPHTHKSHTDRTPRGVRGLPAGCGTAARAALFPVRRHPGASQEFTRSHLRVARGPPVSRCGSGTGRPAKI